MPLGLIFLVLGAAALVGVLLWRGERPGPPGAGGPAGPGQPYADPFDYQPRPVLAPEAELFYMRLREAVGPNHDVWARTPVVELVGLRSDAEPARRPMLEQALSGLRADFAIVLAAEVIAVIGLEAPGRDARRDAFQDAVLRQCGYRVLRFDPKVGIPKVGALRDWLGPVIGS